jgi:hypothetical protein
MRLMSCLVFAILVTVAGVRDAHAGGPQLQYVWGGSAGTVVFVHGKADCSTSMTDCNSFDSTKGPVGYWTNSANNYDLLNEGTTKYAWNGSAQTTSYYEAFVIGFDYRNKGFWDAANDVGACLQDFYSGTNASGCNPNKYQRTSFHLVTHSAGATVVDRLLSTGWYSINSHLIGGVLSIAPALAGSRASSALYGVDGFGNFCTSLVSWLAGWAIKDPAAQSLTRGAVIGEANKGYAGRSPRWIDKITTTGGGGSANNNHSASVNEHDNDTSMGALASCLGYSSSDDMDGLLYWSDSDPTNNTAANGCPTSDHSCHYYAQFSGSYWHWFESWANHSHSRDDAYTTTGDWASCSAGGCVCYFRSPGTCIAQTGY